MEFKFNVNKLLPRKINKVTHTLIPEDFRDENYLPCIDLRKPKQLPFYWLLMSPNIFKSKVALSEHI
ncbi:hypothetical protein K0M31_005945 [Melipona bicolor]|uniref:Uncharacterized protein n=1 Tax=Melipona bicolor TaxID=60889 RepID=A0AA40FUE1_9HYME|nr:hypothetical protein K0M31_005945 [Melipona bicolor]